MNPAEFVKAHTDLVRPLVLAEASAWWDLNVKGRPEDAEAAQAARERLARVYADAEAYDRVRGFTIAGSPADAAVARQVRLLRLAFEAGQRDEETIRREAALSTALEALFATHRPVVSGRPMAQNELSRILRDSADPALRREAWEASVEIGSRAAPAVLELVSLRNAAARKLGHRDHYAMSLALSEIDEDHLLRVLDEVSQRTAAPFAVAKEKLDRELAERFSIAPGDLMPWHYADPFFQEVPPDPVAGLDELFSDKDLKALTVRTFEGLGLDVRGIMGQSDLHPRDGKCQHAFCIDMDRAGDVRVLANVEPSERWMITMLHEFGHAAYDRYVSPDLPFLLKVPSHPLMTEAVAMLLQRLARDRDWLARAGGLPAAEAAERAAALAARARLEKLVMARFMLVMCRFERILYSEAPGDLNRIWWDEKEALQGLRRPAGRSAPDWAAKIHFSVAPVYYQNYLLGELVASQLEHWLRGLSPDGGLADSRAAGRALVDRLFRPGALRDWRRALVHATGEELEVAHFVRQIS